MPSVRFSEKETNSDLPPIQVIFGCTPEMELIRRKLAMIAKTNVPVLIQGESGTGKELCARLIHGTSENEPGGPGDLVKVSCPAIPQGLIETELFGYEKGAFTGAHSTKRGRVEQAHSGTLLLDEVGSLDLAVQSKLLQVLQDGTFMRVGGHETRTIRTRVISVANRDLRDQVAEGTFRLDFLFRINAVTLHLPPLRRRAEDISQLVDYFIGHHARAFHTRPPALSRGTLRMMEKFDWPGNIRQLDNLIRSYVLLGNEDALLSELIEEDRAPTNVMADLDLTEPIALKMVTRKATQSLERQIILKVLKANNWNRQKTAKFLKISYRSLLYKLNDVEASGTPELTRPPTRTKTQATTGLSTGIESSRHIQ